MIIVRFSNDIRKVAMMMDWSFQAAVVVTHSAHAKKSFFPKAWDELSQRQLFWLVDPNLPKGERVPTSKDCKVEARVSDMGKSLTNSNSFSNPQNCNKATQIWCQIFASESPYRWICPCSCHELQGQWHLWAGQISRSSQRCASNQKCCCF